MFIYYLLLPKAVVDIDAIATVMIEKSFIDAADKGISELDL